MEVNLLSLPCKPGYLRLTDHAGSTTLELIPYEAFLLRPEIRKGLLSKISANGCRLCCACQPANTIPVEIHDDLSFEYPEYGHMDECEAYLRRIHNLVDNGYLRECLAADSPYQVSFKTADQKRFSPKLDCLTGFDLDGASVRRMGLHELVGFAVSRAYNRSVEARAKYQGAASQPRPDSILSAIEIEFNLIKIIDDDGVEISLADRICDPENLKSGETDFLVGRINAVRISGKDAVLYCSVSHKGWVNPKNIPVRVSAKDWELFTLSHEQITGGVIDGKFQGLHIAGFVKHREQKTMQGVRFNRRTRSKYVSEESQSYILTRIRGAVLFSLSSYGMVISQDKQRRLSDAYNKNGFQCTKPILPVACCDDVPDMVISNPGGPDLVIVYPWTPDTASNDFVRIVNY